MKKGLKKVLVLVMSVVMLAGSVLTAMAAEAGDVNVTIKMNYPEQEAKEALVVTKTVNFNSEEAENGKAIDVTDVIPAGYTLMGLDSNVVTVYSDTPVVELFLEKEAESVITGDVTLTVNVRDYATDKVIDTKYHAVNFVAEDNNVKTVKVADLAQYVPEGYTVWDGMAKTTQVDATSAANAIELYVVKTGTGITGDVSLKVNVKDNATDELLASEYHIIKFAAEDNNHKAVKVADLAQYVPAGYVIWDGMAETVDVDATFGNNTVDLYVVKAEETYYINYYSVEGKQAAEVAVKGSNKVVPFETVVANMPAGYEFAEEYTTDFEVMDRYVWVSVKPVAERNVFVAFVDEATGEELADVLAIKVAGTTFHTSAITKLPEGYELCEAGDVYVGTADKVSVNVRKSEKTIYVSYIDEETKMPFENGIEEIKVAADATYFNTSVLTAVPEGYELCVVGDVYFGENDTVNVEVRKAATTKEVKINLYDEEAEKQVAEPVVVVDVDATYVNTSVFASCVPEGYELVLVGDLEIRDGYVYAPVRKVADAPVVPEKPEDTNKPAEKPAKPAEKPAETVKTGDVSTFLPMVIVMVGAVAVVTVLSLRRKNRR